MSSTFYYMFKGNMIQTDFILKLFFFYSVDVQQTF